MNAKDEFDKSLIQTIDIKLKHVFGEAGTSVIYNYLKSALSLPQNEIPKKLDVFTEGLTRFLSSGAMVVEKVILIDLYSEFGQEFHSREGFKFVDYVNELKAALVKNDD
ncbi:MAG: hypothetical protein JSV05_05070 [Candidatus Bathyarchaeota archaeon]|nr:MAG: hypothetical protein JSV05_05070 [Candidatus Bathyarchaeota archaeon]